MESRNPQLELCAGTYHARSAEGTVVVFAEGVHFTSGFHTFLFQESGSDGPPAFSIWHVRPGGPVLQTVTPFSVCTAFQTLRAVTGVLVRDARGVREVAVRHGEASFAQS